MSIMDSTTEMTAPLALNYPDARGSALERYVSTPFFVASTLISQVVVTALVGGTMLAGHGRTNIADRPRYKGQGARNHWHRLVESRVCPAGSLPGSGLSGAPWLSLGLARKTHVGGRRWVAPNPNLPAPEADSRVGTMAALACHARLARRKRVDMHTAKRIYLLPILALALAPVVGGCISTGGPEWKWRRCYKGPRRAPADVSILLVDREPVPLRVRSIDGADVREATEYHLLPGKHVVVSKPDIPLRFLIEYKDQACVLATPPTGECGAGAVTATWTLEPGIVYRLTAELAWEREGTSRVYWQGRGGKWRPRVDALGSFEASQSKLAEQQERYRLCLREQRGPTDLNDIPWPLVALHTAENPPKHWRPVSEGR